MRARVSVLVARAVVSAVLVGAALTKLADPAEFTAAIERYRLVPPVVAGAAALYVPWLELVLAAAWWRTRWRTAAGLLVCGLLVVFVAAVASAWARGLDIDCGCFGKALDASLPLALARNVVLLAAAAWVWRADAAGK